MKKKIISICIVAIIAITAIAGASLAYLSDTDYEKNVMTIGNVLIVQEEWENDEEGNVVEFTDDKLLVPYTGKTDANGIASEYNSTLYYPKTDGTVGSGKGFSTAKNAVDKIVTVKNTGSLPAYIRTLFAFELSKDGVNPAEDGVDQLNYVMFNDGTCWKWTGVTIEVDGVNYAVAEYYYNFNEVDGQKSAIAAGEISYPSLTQIYLNSKVGNEWYENFGEQYNILALSQATQMSGFDDAVNALNTAFAEVTADNQATVQQWFVDYATPAGSN